MRVIDAVDGAGRYITRDPSLWQDARDAQEQRRRHDPWEDILADDGRMGNIIEESNDGFDHVASANVLCRMLDIPKAQQISAQAQRLAKQ